MRALKRSLPVNIPDTPITTAAEASALLNDWLDAQHQRAADDYALQFILMSPVQSQLQRAQLVLTNLDHDPGPGPAVSSTLRGPIGEPQARRSGSYVVDEPEVTPYGVASHGEPLRQLAGVVADVVAVSALAKRAAHCAQRDRANDRPRWAERWQQEADALTAYAADLEQRLIEPLSTPVIDELRAHEAKQSPRPVVRPVRLR